MKMKSYTYDERVKQRRYAAAAAAAAISLSK